jgi:hypothetical protein
MAWISATWMTWLVSQRSRVTGGLQRRCLSPAATA